METLRPAAVNLTSSSSSASTARSGLLRSVAAKLGRARKGAAAATKASDAKGNNNNKPPPPPSPQKHELYLDDYYTASLLSRSDDKDRAFKPKQQQQLQQLHVVVETRTDRDDETGGGGIEVEPLLARIFACVSAIKAAYVEIQLAQRPYNPEMVQAADVTVINELRRISVLKQTYFQAKQQQHQNKKLGLLDGGGDDVSAASAQAEAEIREKKSLVRAYEITANKLEAEVESKGGEVAELRDRLRELEKKNRALEHRLRHLPRQNSSAGSSPATNSTTTTTTLSSLDGFHLSALNPTHFLTALRYTVKSVKDLVRVLVREMEAAGWDLAAAAAAIAPCAGAPEAPPEARELAVESYVCMGMFSDFHLGPGFRDAASSATVDDRQSCFDEFSTARSCSSAKDLARLRRPFAEFCRTKYAAIVRPEMEAAFFAGMDRRAMAEAELFVAFAEMSWRVWMLHWLFWSFEPDARADQPLFRADPGMRYSELFMDSVGLTAASADPARAVVGFTVVPGFQLRRTVIQCRVYLVPSPSLLSSEGAGR